MTANEDCVSETLQRPYAVTQDRLRKDVENYYLPFILPPPYRQTYLKVCVRFRQDAQTGDSVGNVLTAFATTDIQEGEAQKWQSHE